MRFASGTQCQSFWITWITLLLVFGKLDNGMIRVYRPNTGTAKMPSTGPTASVRISLLGLWARLLFEYGAICLKRCKIVYFRRR